jgi:hypothetical protein
MAIKATKEGQETRWIVFSNFTNSSDYEKLIIHHLKDGWNLEHGFDYADVMNLWGRENLNIVGWLNHSLALEWSDEVAQARDLIEKAVK